MLSRPDGATVEEVATALVCAIARARRLVEHINLFLGHGIVVDADGVIRATPPLGSPPTPPEIFHDHQRPTETPCRERDRDRYRPRARTAQRPCLTCRRTFQSEGSHNQMCPACIKTAAGVSPYTPDG